MKPNFALDLSQTGIRLLHRGAEEEEELGRVALDAPDFEAAVAALRDRAAALAKGRLRVELLIPNSEILYTSVAAPGPDRDARDAAVRAALEGRTPYALDELVYDWRAQKGEALVAAVARETLDEAEAFANAHGFAPAGFSARPEPGRFRGRPDFGPPGTPPAEPEQSPEAEADRALAAPPPEAAGIAAAAIPAAEAAEEESAAGTKAAETAEQAAPTAEPAAEAPTPTPQAPEVPDAKASETAETSEAPETSEVSRAENDTTPPRDVAAATSAEEAATPGSADTDAPAETAAETVPPTGEADAAPAAGEDRSAPPRDDDTREAREETPMRPGQAAGSPAPERAPETPTSARTADPAKSEAKASPARNGRPAGPAAAEKAPDAAPAEDTDPAGARSGGAALAPGHPAAGGWPLAGGVAKAEGAGLRLAPVGDEAAERPDTTGDAPIPFASRRRAAATGTGDDGDAAPATGPLAQIAARAASLPDGGTPLETPPAKGAKANGRAARAAAATGAAAAGTAAGAKPRPGATAPDATPRIGPARPRPGPVKPAAPPVARPAAEGETAAEAGSGSLAARMAAGRRLDEAEAMTVFGARGRDTAAPRGTSPVMVGIALALALAAAIWGAYFLIGDPSSDIAEPAAEPTAEQGLASTGGPVIDEPVPPAPIDGPAEEAAGSDTAALAPEPQAPADAAGQPDPGADVAPSAGEARPPQQAAAPEATPGPAPQPALPAPLSPDQAVARYAATGIWQMSPEAPDEPQGDRVDELYTAATDSRLLLEDSTAPDLPRPVDPDRLVAPVAPLPPAPPGTEFRLNDEGLVVATPQGALSPDGIRVVAGAPPARPPEHPPRTISAEPLPEALRPGPDTPSTRPRLRPGSAAAPAGETPQAADPAAGDTATGDAATGDGAAAETGQGSPADQAAIRPRTAPDAAPRSDARRAATDPDSVLTEAQRRLAAISPRARPKSVEEAAAERAAARASAAAGTAQAVSAAVTTAVAEAAAGAVQEASLDPELAPEPEEISPFAVARSPAPAPRPEGFGAVVQKESRPVAAASVAKPSLPTSASVAKRATLSNALNLRSLNLIGVYGSDANRRALLRLPSGKFVKVKVGDRVDGGQIAAIGDSALRYVKGGRNFTLTMPEG